LTTGTVISQAQDLDELITFSLNYKLPANSGPGDCIISVAIHIDKGFPLNGKRFVIDQLLQIYRELWGEEGKHSDVTVSLLPENIPPEIKPALASFDGSELVMLVFETFSSIENKGILYFDKPVDIIYAESLPFYPDVPVENLAKFRGNGHEGTVEFVLDKIYNEEECKRIINGNLINISTAILSYRSEFLTFPLDLSELEVTGHLLVNLINPYSGLPVRSVSDDLSMRPGDIRYNYSGPDHVSIVSFLADGSTVKRDINVSSNPDFNLLLQKTHGLSENDRRVCIYTFQLSHIINEYYYANKTLPEKVPQIESNLFASVSFLNPFTMEPVKQIVNPLEKSEGDYFYYKTANDQYLLVGYGENLNEILNIQRMLGGKE
jgi:hypothetical protein